GGGPERADDQDHGQQRDQRGDADHGGRWAATSWWGDGRRGEWGGRRQSVERHGDRRAGHAGTGQGDVGERSAGGGRHGDGDGRGGIQRQRGTGLSVRDERDADDRGGGHDSRPAVGHGGAGRGAAGAAGHGGGGAERADDHGEWQQRDEPGDAAGRERRAAKC